MATSCAPRHRVRGMECRPLGFVTRLCVAIRTTSLELPLRRANHRKVDPKSLPVFLFVYVAALALSSVPRTNATSIPMWAAVNVTEVDAGLYGDSTSKTAVPEPAPLLLTFVVRLAQPFTGQRIVHPQKEKAL
jgi:hypothetical protein